MGVFTRFNCLFLFILGGLVFGNHLQDQVQQPKVHAHNDYHYNQPFHHAYAHRVDYLDRVAACSRHLANPYE